MIRTVRMILGTWCVAKRREAAEIGCRRPSLCSRAAKTIGDPQQQWQRDPLSHPEVRGMSMTQLADLAFDPHRIRDE
jgi:hypothetical protein